MVGRRRGSSQQVLEARSKEIVQSATILDLGSFRYKVSSQSVADTFYDISFGPDGWRCTCPYHLYGKRRCKHIRAVCSIVMDTGRLADEVRKEVAVTEPCVTCTFCQGTDCIKRGVRRNKNGTVPRYKCNSCGHKFTHNPGFVGRHHPPEVITDVLQSYAAGLSTTKIIDCLAKKGIGVSAATVLRWARDYGNLLKRFQRTCMRTGYVWHADEIHFKVRGQSRWMFGVMDSETKLIIAHDTAEDKFGYDAAGLFEAAVRAAGKRPDVLVTDGLAGFKVGYTKAMYTKAVPRTVHVADVGIRDRHPANNVYERFNGEIRDRIARVRGFKSKDPALLALLIIYHNFMRPHGGLGGRTPAEAVGITISGPDKWRTLIGHTALFCA